MTKNGSLTLPLVLIFLVIFIFPARSLSMTSVNVDLDSWTYPALEKLTATGLIKSDVMNTRPLTRVELARLTGEALASAEERKCGDQLSGLSLYLLERLKGEFKDELSILGIIDDVSVHTFIKPVDELRVRYHLLDGGHAIYNNDGIRYGDDHNASLEFSGRGKLFNTISFYYRPIVRYNQDLDDEEETELELLRGYIKVNLGNVELEIGRDSLWWGPGHHGSLLMTNNAEPFDMVKVSNSRPIILPWVFRYLGPFKTTWFLTELEKDREVPEPYLTGFRVNFKPLPVLEIGASRVIMMGGDGRPDVDFGDILKVITGENISGAEEDTSNQIASVDFSLRLEFLRNTEIYGELGGEDEAGGLPTKKGYLAGIYFPRVTHDGRVDLRVEYAYNHVDGHPNVWYNHSVYKTGYRYEDSVIGHHMGSDAEDLFARVTGCVTGRMTVGMDFDFEERSKSDPFPEKHYQYGIDLSYDINDMIHIAGRYGFEKVKNHNKTDGAEEEYHFFSTELEIRF